MLQIRGKIEWIITIFCNTLMRWQLTKCILNKQLHLLDICRDNYTYLLLTIITWICSDKSGMFEIMSDLASEERLFYYQLALIWQAVLTPFLQSGNQSVTSNFCCSYKWCRWDPATIIQNTPILNLQGTKWMFGRRKSTCIETNNNTTKIYIDNNVGI